MDTTPISGLIEADHINQVFRLVRRELLSTRAGKPYLNIVLGDSSGEIEGKVWDSADTIHQQLTDFSYVRVIGVVDSYHGKLQVKIEQLKAIPTEDIDPALFLPSTEKDSDAVLAELKKLVLENVEDEHLLKLLEEFFADEELMTKFKKSPGAKGLHHSYIGGLLEHTLSVAQICLFMADHYPSVNRDILVAGAVLHDIGKVDELVSEPNFDYSTEGRLIGHVVIGDRIFQRLADRVDQFPEKLRMIVSHLLLSHMGEHEFKAPVVPMCTEAVLLYSVDNLDSKTELTLHYIESDSGSGSDFTNYHRLLERFFYKGVE